MNEKIALLILMNIEKIGNVTAKKIMDSLIGKNITLEEIYSAINKNSKTKIKNMNELIQAQKNAEEILKKLNNNKEVNMITYFDKDYPKAFLSIRDPPVYLFYSGDINLLSQRCVAVVGTRQPTEYSKKIAYDLTSNLCKNNVIVSGLAEGIDTQAHKSTIDNGGKTIAILGNGLDIIFPESNEGLSKQIVKKGGLVMSEYPLGQTYSRFTFIARDRLQSALSEQVFVIETEDTGGTMQTAKKAIEYKKKLFVFKSKQQNIRLSSGNDLLIKNGATTFNEDFRIN
ncbi:MAG: DNA-processing protein DprA [Candidatus Nanoarchaeia archaeon]